MDQTIKVHLGVEVNGKTFEFSAPVGAPLKEAHDALCLFLQQLVKIAEDSANKNANSAPADGTQSAPKA